VVGDGCDVRGEERRRIKKKKKKKKNIKMSAVGKEERTKDQKNLETGQSGLEMEQGQSRRRWKQCNLKDSWSGLRGRVL
jgi:hypothetical protein